MTKEVRHYVNYVVTCSTPEAVTRDQVKDATEEDPALQVLKKYINEGWIDTNDTRTHEFRQVFHELTIVDGIVLRGDRIIVPAKLRHRKVEIAHEGHKGQVRTKQLLRAHVWFPGMDSQRDKFVSTCIACQSNRPQTHHEPLRMTDLPDGPWDKVSVDFCGPIASGDLALVYARYPVVEFVGSTSEKATIPTFKSVFDIYGVPKEISQITDHPSTAISSKNTQKRRGSSNEK